MEDGLEGLAESRGVGAGVGDLVVLARVLERLLPLPDGPHDGHVLARPAEGLSVGHPVPPLDDLGARGADPQEEAPARQLVQGRGGHRRHGRGARRHLHDGGAQVDPLGAGRDEGEGGHRITAVGLGGPDGMKAEALGLQDKGQVQREGRARIAEIESEPHGVSLLHLGTGTRAVFIRSSRTAGPQPRDVLRLARPSRPPPPDSRASSAPVLNVSPRNRGAAIPDRVALTTIAPRAPSVEPPTGARFGQNS
ncbi:MAG: hypothetical protein XU13_C0019G0023 [Candidatus Rokubacteria bacterium CSP1-6]|nr:MAG: hypothetical protein XU13_C0019G0023 [Candidatus Rokubacteria bacterium CSP1-6]